MPKLYELYLAETGLNPAATEYPLKRTRHEVAARGDVVNPEVPEGVATLAWGILLNDCLRIERGPYRDTTIKQLIQQAAEAYPEFIALLPLLESSTP